jgi:hypothetical protein
MVFTFLWAVVLFLVSLLPRFAMAWILSFVVLVLTFSTAKSRVRERVTAFDESVRYWAGGLRYRLREDLSTDRIARVMPVRCCCRLSSSAISDASARRAKAKRSATS